MADKRRSKKRKDEYTGPGGAEQELEKATKEEYKVAKWLKSNVATKKTKFLNHNVEYFSAVRAVDALLASKFAQGENCLFPHRQAVIDFLDEMLHHKFFHRARKVPVSEQELRGKVKKSTEKEKEKSKDDKGTDGGESSHAEGGKGDKMAAEKEKRKRKIRLEMHPEQLFVDGHEAYVWLYDPIPMHYWIFGALLVVGAIVICLFPLWPPLLRKGVYYLSIAAAGFLVFILGLAVLRFVLFCFVWILTGGKHHFWLLPNLTEDVGFFASFWPLYDHEYKDGSTDKDKSKKNKKRKRDKDSDAEDDEPGVTLPPKIDEIKEHDAEQVKAEESELRYRGKETVAEEKVVETTVASEGQDADHGEEEKHTPSESESEGSQRSSTGKDFEIVDPDEVENT
ncbi:translocation protein SEC62 [Toxorhynchites rutilus septentrionalis]|uniref:translocation protein SEC62 n=1 Tax=Toxorhynchites rutilus septentrionalis TaxID=329112 RepID=UPI00247AC632|nr:translocation protein SEC62 [Toxorhynchites rutilus septentrionalis]